MDQAENVDGLFVDLENETVVTDEELAHIRLTELRHHSTTEGELVERPGMLANALDEGSSVAGGVLSDVVGGALEIAPSGLGPDYFSSHRAIRRSASSCGSVRPASTSWRPRPMHWRT